MAIGYARSRIARVFTQRCFYLFFAVLLLVVLAPLMVEAQRGRIIANAVNAFILIAAVAAVGRTMISFVVAVLLAVPTIGFQIVALQQGLPNLQMVSNAFGAAFYAVTIVYLLAYVLRREVMTDDKLYGAAAAYLMGGVFWAFCYSLVQYFVPDSFSAGGRTLLTPVDLIYFSFTVLTSTGFGDIVPLQPLARSVTILEQIAGVLFIAILVARLAGIYPPERQRRPDAD